MGFVEHVNPPVCRCVTDQDLQRVLELMATGVDQVTASRMVWAPDLLVAAPAQQPTQQPRVVRPTLAAADRSSWSQRIRRALRGPAGGGER